MQSNEQTAWLTRVSGVHAGVRSALKPPAMLIGRDLICDIVTGAAEDAVVSSQHAELYRDESGWRVRDLGSTNGTFLNGVRIQDAPLHPGIFLRLGASGPQFVFQFASLDGAGLDTTVTAPPLILPEQVEETPGHDDTLAAAVHKARQLRSAGEHGQTMTIMREAMRQAVTKSSRPLHRIIAGLAVLLVVGGALSFWRLRSLQQTKTDVDKEILSIEQDLESGDLDEDQIGALVARLDEYQRQAVQLQDSVFYHFGVEGREQAFIEREVRAVLREFGAEQYSIPPEFIQQVQRYVERRRTVERGPVERLVGSHRKDFDAMRAIFEKQKLPPDLAYIVLVESDFEHKSMSDEGAAGLWQLTPSTARAYGLKVSDTVDERYHLAKSTEAAGRYIRALIAEFGSGSSVMLALAAYNYGPGKIRTAIRRLDAPVQQRNFWYFYRARVLPSETRQYVPKIMAAMIVGRNLERFGF